MRLYFLILLGILGWNSVATPQNFQVCTMTLNSVEEIEVFRQHLPDSHFSFVELVPRTSYDPEEDHSMRWFNKSCHRSDIQCDILIVSGHFAGTFFGTENNHMLSIDELEKLACRNGCPRIFNNLKEVFLFGCNTMADKKQIQRTSEEYLEVLLEYDLPRSIAENVVSGRFSPLGLTYKDKMEHIFSPQTRIYGFSELSPLGKQSISVLNRYLKGVKSEFGSYYKYLVHDFYKNQEKTHNRHFQEALSPIALVRQSYGMDQEHPRYETFQQMCRLYSDQEVEGEKIEVVKDLLEKGEGLFAFSAIKDFLVHRKENFSQAELQTFKQIQQLDTIQSEFLEVYSQMSSALVYVKSVLLHFLGMMEWMPRESYHQELTSVLHPTITSPALQSYDILNSLIKYDQLNPLDIEINLDDFSYDYFQNIWSILLVDLLRLNHISIQTWVMDYCLDNLEQNNKVICYQAFKTLGHLQVQDKEIRESMAHFLESEDEGLIYYALYGLTLAGVGDPQIQVEMIQQVYHPNFWIRLQAIRGLDYLGLIEEEPQVYELLLQALERERHPDVITLLRYVLNIQ